MKSKILPTSCNENKEESQEANIIGTWTQRVDQPTRSAALHIQYTDDVCADG